MKITVRLVKNPLSLAGILLLVVFMSIAILAPVIAPPGPYQLSPYMIPRDGFWATPRPPSSEHFFGTTEGQFDIYYGIIWGARTAFRIGLIVVLVSALIGLIIGSISAFYGGLIDELLMRITDVFMSFPLVVAAMILTAILGKGINQMMIALIVFSWMRYARLIRSEILHIKEMDYVQAARASGATDLRLILHHILPNSFYPVLVQGTMSIGLMVLTAAALSFLGLGAEPGYADWGQLISYARNWIIGQAGNPFQYWYVLVFPGIAISLFVLAWNLIGDALRDILDPRMHIKS